MRQNKKVQFSDHFGLLRSRISVHDLISRIFLVFAVVLPLIFGAAESKSQETVRKGITFWLLDENDGTWRIPLPNWNVDDIMKAVDHSVERDQERPYTIQSINTNGKVENGIARLTIQYRIFTKNENVVRVPLGLNEGIYIASSKQTDSENASDIYKSIKYNGTGSYYIEFDRTLNSYIAVFQNKTASNDPQMMSLSADDEKKEIPLNNTQNQKNTPTNGILPDLKLDSSKNRSNHSEETKTSPKMDQSAASKQDKPGITAAPKVSAPNPASDNKSDEKKATDPTTVDKNKENAAAAKPVLPVTPPVQHNVQKVQAPLPSGLRNEAVSTGVKAIGDRSHFLARMNAEFNGNPTRRGMLRHTLTLTLCFPVETTENNEHRLKVSFPPAVSGKIRLEVPLPEVQFTATQGILAMPPVSLNGQTSEITLNGLNRSGNPTEIIWSRKETHTVKNQVVLQVEDAQIDVMPNHQDVQMDVTLPVRVNGGEADIFKIRIPGSVRFQKETLVAAGNGNVILDIRSIMEETVSPGSTKSENKPSPGTNSPQPASGVKVTGAKEIKPKDTGVKNVNGKKETAGPDPFKSDENLAKAIADQAKYSIVEIRLARPASNTVTFRFKAVIQEINREKRSNSPSWQLEGFELLGAQKQYGQIKFMFPRDLTYKVTPKYGVHFNPAEEDASGQDIERYLFYTQPFALDLQIMIQQTRIKVKPEYQITIGRGEINLHALFQFTIYGSKVRQLALKTEDWFISDVKSNYIVDYERIYEDSRGNELILPLTAASEGQLNIELNAVRKINADNTKIDFQIPVPIADWVESGPVVVLPDDNIELLPLNDGIRGLRTMNLRGLTVTLDLPTRQQQPVTYLMENRDNRKNISGSNSLPVFSANLKYHTRQLEIRSEAVVSLEKRNDNNIQQTLTCLVKYEPLESLTLSVPESIKDPSALKILVDGKPVSEQNIVQETGSGIAQDTIRKKILFNEKPIIGECTISLVYPRKNINLLPQMTNKFSVDLVQPTEGSLTVNRFSVIAPSGLKIESAATENSFWLLDAERSSLKGDLQTFCFNAKSVQPKIVLNGIINARDIFGTTLVERSWIQTWLVNSARLDRAAYRIVSDQPSLSIKLPFRVRRDCISFLLNGKPIYLNQNPLELSPDNPVIYNDKKELVFLIPEEYRMKPITVEISWIIDMPSDQNQYEIDFPKFTGSAVTMRRTYWQVILPANRHLFGTLPDWTAEYFKLVWTGFYWKREAALSQDELVSWLGVAPREKIPAETNCYLFSSFNTPNISSLHSIDRSFLILLGSGIALIIGFGFIYLPLIRNRGVLFICVILLAALCSWQPSEALIFLQSAFFGILLTVFTLFLARIFGASSRPIHSGQTSDRTGHQIPIIRPRTGSSIESQSNAWNTDKEETRP